MGNCYKKQRRPTSVLRLNQTRDLSVDTDDGLPYVLVFNNTQSAANERRRGQSREHQSFFRNLFRRGNTPRNNSNESPPFSLCLLTDEVLDKHVIETLSTLRSSAENDTSLILRMRMFRNWANGETGWNMVLNSLIRAVPLDDVLGPSAITLFIDHCPLPSKPSVMKLIGDLSLSREKALEEFSYDKHSNKLARHRNVCAVLGHLAETLPVPLTTAILSESTLNYFIAGLDINKASIPVVDILHSLIALEKFAQAGENKRKIMDANIVEKLLGLEKWAKSTDYKKRQVGFSAQWLLDNTFVAEDRHFTYETVDLSEINAMLNCNDVSEYLKISPDGLEARSDASSFESVRCTFSVDSGVWYYEVTIITPGVMQIGWATKDSKFFNYDGYGIGDDDYSCAYDGCRQLYWHVAQSRPHSHPPWKEGDVLGLLLDLEASEVIFSLNGDSLPPENGVFNSARSGFFAAASFMSHQQCIFNFGSTPFKFPPTNRTFSSFNSHAHLSDEEKLVLPKLKKFQLLKRISIDMNTCNLCCDLPADTTLLPCGHDGLCHRCANILDTCPLCRGEISEKIMESKKTDEPTKT